MTDHEQQLELISRYFDHDLSEQEILDLQDWINDSTQNAVLFSRHAFSHHLLRDGIVVHNAVTRHDTDRKSDIGSEEFLSELLLVEETINIELVDATELVFHDRPKRTSRAVKRDRHQHSRTSTVIVIPRWVAASVAALLVLSIVILTLNNPTQQNQPTPSADTPGNTTVPPVATLYVRHPDSGATAVRDVFIGDSIESFDSGMYLEYLSGCTISLAIDSEIQITGEDACRLKVGHITGTVPPSAIGFEVVIPDGFVRDLGTEFTVQVDEAGISKVDVIVGAVSLHKETLSGDHLPGRVLNAGDAGILNPALPNLLVQQEVLMRLDSTGAGAAVGDTDSNWTISSIDGVSNVRSISAIVVGGDFGNHAQVWAANTAQSAWIAPLPSTWKPISSLLSIPTGQRTVYQYHFVLPLTEDLDSIRIPAEIWVDNELVSISVNGKVVLDSSKDAFLTSIRYEHPTRLVIDEGFQVGDNIIEFSVLNHDDQVDFGQLTTPSGLRVQFQDFTITAFVPDE